MDPYERIVVYPDREFHNRLATTHYASTTNPIDPDQPGHHPRPTTRATSPARRRSLAPVNSLSPRGVV
ncbi:MAG: hypothetical protein R2838_06250 [Caldilineaceae bacterium]